MVFEDLGRVWQEQGTGDFQRRKVEVESLSTVRARAERLLGGIHRRGKWSVALTALLCVPMFTWGVLNSQRPWLAAPGVLILWAWLGYMLKVVLDLQAPRVVEPPPVRDSVASEVERLLILERFWANVHWVFLVFLVGEVMAYEGFRGGDSERLVFYALLTLLVVYGTIARRRDARAKVRPLRQELEGWLSGLETFDFDRELDAGTHGGTP